MNFKRIKITAIWLGGLYGLALLGILGIFFLVAGIYTAFQAPSWKDVITILLGFGVLLLLVGLAFRKFVNEFYDWLAYQRSLAILEELDNKHKVEDQFNALLQKYESEVSLELSDAFKKQLRSSPTFQQTVEEAVRLVLEYITFDNGNHTAEEQVAFQRSWKTKSEAFAARIAEGDPLAVEVILKAIEKESERCTTE